MATPVKLHETTLPVTGGKFRFWKVECGGFEGSGATPEEALETFKEALRLFAPNDKNVYVLPRKKEAARSE